MNTISLTASNQASVNRMTESDFWDRMYNGGVSRDAWYRRVARRHIDQFLRRVLYEQKAAPRVLELGCAPGRMLCRLNRLRPDCRFSGIDFSPSGVETSEVATRELGMRANIVQGDLFQVDLPDQHEIVMSFGLVEHFLDPSSILKQHARFCRPGGRVAITIPNFAPVKKLAYWTKPEQADAHNFQIMSRERLRDAMVDAGFDDIQIHGLGGPRVWMEADQNRLWGRLYFRLAQAWNFFASLMPGSFTWYGTYAATGRVV